MQPIAYVLALGVYWGSLSTLQHTLGVIVAVREAIYFLGTVAGLYLKPAYLLVDMGATWASDRGDDGLVGFLVYVLSPEKYVLTAILGDAGVYLSFALIPFDLAGEAAFVSAVLPGQGLPAPLIVGYVVTALASVTLPLGVYRASRKIDAEDAERRDRQEEAPDETPPE